MRRDVYQAIADPVRRDIIQLLSKQSMNINTVAKHYEISRPAISRHLKILKECGLISVDQKGRERFCKVKPKMLASASKWIDQYKKPNSKKTNPTP